MAASPRSLLLLSGHRDLALKPSSPLLSRHLLIPQRARKSSRPLYSCSPAVVTGCLVSGVDGGGVSDDFISTRSSGPAGRLEFSALASMLRRIEPLDTSVIGKGVSAPARDSMKRTISTMLGLIPSDQFRVSVRLYKQPLHHLLVSSIITGYTLWNAEYRVSLMRNFESSPGCAEAAVASSNGIEVLAEKIEGREDGNGVQAVDFGVGTIAPGCLSDLCPAALSYIQELESQLATAEKELDDQEQKFIHLTHNKEGNNDLLKYLRSLEPDMVFELSQPSSPEVEEIIQQLVQNIHLSFLQDLDERESGDHEKDVNHDDVVVTTRDYLAKLLFWCMLLGHHLRGLEHRLHLSCVVGLL